MRRAALLLAALALGLLLGRVSAPSSAGEPAAPGEVSTTALHRTREGAMLAAATYQQEFASPSVLRPGVLRRRVERVATARFAPVMIAANEPGAERLAHGRFGWSLRAGARSVFFAVPVSRRLLSYSPRRAVVQTWGFTLLGNDAGLEPSAYFGLARTILVWRRGRWLIAGTRASFGPTPRLATPRRGGEGLDLIELSEELRPYGIAP